MDTSDSSINLTVRFHNDTMSYSTEVPFVETDVILFAVFTFIFMVFGIAANILTMMVIGSSNKLRSIFHFFIFSLCVSDTASALVSWINLYRRTWGFDDFALPNFICVIFWAFDIWTSYSTALHILSFAVLRFVSIKSPHKMTALKNGYPVGLLWIILIWIVTFFAGALPFGVITGARPKDRSSSNPVSKWPSCTLLPELLQFLSNYTIIAYPIFFYIPIVFTVAVSISIVILMLRRNRSMKNHVSAASAKKRRTKEKHAVIQLTLIVTSFIIGYVPFTAFEFFTTSQDNTTYENWWIDWHFGTTQYMFLRLSECLNPIFYNLGSKTLRDETKRFIRKYCCCFGPKPSTKPRNSLTASTMTGFV